MEVAHPLTLNYGAPIVSIDATICGEGTPYVGFVIPMQCMYEMSASLAHMVASIEAIRAP